uniref:CSON006517 protein n=1 Tax=Culicoides sonorensis TaxID=179676 RepID=A0A336LZ66_CULSO
MPGSRIFNRNKSLGFVSNHVPAAVRYYQKRKENIIVTCTGRSVHAFTSGFRLINSTPLHSEDINCVATDPFLVHVAAGKNIYSWRSGREIKKTFIGHKANIHLLLPFGPHLIAVDEDNVMKVWDIESELVYLEIPFDKTSFKVTSIVHPPTYVNKIVLGSEQGTLQLWNLKSSKLIYTFNKYDSKITVLEAAPASDIIAIGMENGRISLLNLKFDEILMEFNQECGAVTSISFRTDGFSIMASGSTSGRVSLWDLEKRKLSSILEAHGDAVSSLVCYNNEPLMFTASPDNSIKLWIFDMPDGGPRLLRRREGHALPPLCIRYHGAGGRHIISAGEDVSMRIFSTVSETLNRSMGQASYNRKAAKTKRSKAKALLMPPVIHFTTETTREKEWDNIAAIHQDYKMVTTWSFDRCAMGELKIVPENLQEKNRTDFSTVATCINLTHCGNFVIIGYSNGDVHRFNIQSGIHRATYGSPAHDSSVQGVVTDNLNQVVISGGFDGEVKFWHFRNTSECLKTLELGEGISFFRFHRDSSLLCVALDDFTVCLIDVDAKYVARKFSGHKSRLTDACFSPDGRWLLTTAMDCVIKVYDIPSSYLIDHFKVEYPCTSMTMSPTGDFLATTHVDYLGINLWANKTLFNHISLRALKETSEPSVMSFPVAGKDSELDPEKDDYEFDEIEDYKSPVTLNEDLLTLSDLALSRWQNLLNLDICKKRNKPKQPPKQPKQAPFFLPTVAGLELKFDLNQIENGQENEDSRIAQISHVENLTAFGRLLKGTIATDDFNEAIKKIISMNVSGIDFEIKSLSPIGGGNIPIMLQFMKMIVKMMQSRVNYELAHSYLGVFLKEHGELIVENQELADCLDELDGVVQDGWKKLEGQLIYGIGVVDSLRNYGFSTTN